MVGGAQWDRLHCVSACVCCVRKSRKAFSELRPKDAQGQLSPKTRCGALEAEEKGHAKALRQGQTQFVPGKESTWSISVAFSFMKLMVDCACFKKSYILSLSGFLVFVFCIYRVILGDI